MSSQEVKYLSTKEAAEKLGVSRVLVWTLATRHNEIPYFKIGKKKLLFLESDVNSFLESKKHNTDKGAVDYAYHA